MHVDATMTTERRVNLRVSGAIRPPHMGVYMDIIVLPLTRLFGNLKYIVLFHSILILGLLSARSCMIMLARSLSRR